MANPDWKGMSREEKIAALAPMLDAGLSASKIAQKFLNATRNAIIGMVTRTPELKFQNSGNVERAKQAALTCKWNSIRATREPGASRNGPKSDRPMFRPTPRRKGAPHVADFTSLSSHEKKVPEHTVHLMDLQAGQCKWPIGDPKHPDFGFCGEDALEHKSYCEAHAARARIA